MERLADSIQISLGYLDGSKKWHEWKPFIMQLRDIVKNLLLKAVNRPVVSVLVKPRGPSCYLLLVEKLCILYQAYEERKRGDLVKRDLRSKL